MSKNIFDEHVNWFEDEAETINEDTEVILELTLGTIGNNIQVCTTPDGTHTAGFAKEPYFKLRKDGATTRISMLDGSIIHHAGRELKTSAKDYKELNDLFGQKSNIKGYEDKDNMWLGMREYIQNFCKSRGYSCQNIPEKAPKFSKSKE